MNSKNLLPKSFYCCRHYWIIAVVAMVFLSCSKEENIEDSVSRNVPTYSVSELDSVLDTLKIDFLQVLDDSSIHTAPYYLELFPERRYMVTTDRSEKSIHLLDIRGAHLATTGREGRGPGEFMGAINLHAGWDNKLYTYDVILRRISRFKVYRNEFTYEKSFSPNLEQGSRLQDIYVTEWGNFGVVRYTIDYKTGKDEFQFYKLDNEFNQEKLLFTMPGNAKMSLDTWSHIDHMAGEKTLWDLDGEWFYHISSHSTIIKKYNLRTGEHKTEIYFELEEREITNETRKQLMEFASSIISRFPVLEETLKAVKSLPLFKDLMVYDGIIYLVIYNYVSGSQQTQIIRIEENTGQVGYVDIPLNLWRVQADSEMIYGIVEDTVEESSSIKFIKLDL